MFIIPFYLSYEIVLSGLIKHGSVYLGTKVLKKFQNK